MDPLELRRKNFITEFPAELPHGLVYDSGNYQGSLDKLLEKLDLDGVPARAGGAARARRLPRRRLLDLRRDLRPRRRRACSGRRAGACRAATSSRRSVRVHPTGAVTVVHRHLAARAGARDRVRPDRGRPARRRRRRSVDVIHGDTKTGPVRQGHVRLALAGGRRRGDRARGREGARQGQADRRAPARGGARGHRGRATAVPRRGLARQGDDARARSPGRPTSRSDLPEGMEAGLDEISFYDPENFVWPFGAHACVVDVDVETGTRERRPLHRGRRLRARRSTRC